MTQQVGFIIDATLDGKPIGTRVNHHIPAETIGVIIQSASERGCHVSADAGGFTITEVQTNGSLRIIDMERFYA